jgi:hypothetical protein
VSALAELIEHTRQDGDPVLAGQAALELAETQDVLVRLLEEYWQPASDDSRDVVCRFCGQRAGIANRIQHRSNCLVLRARALLK